MLQVLWFAVCALPHIVFGNPPPPHRRRRSTIDAQKGRCAPLRHVVSGTQSRDGPKVRAPQVHLVRLHVSGRREVRESVQITVKGKQESLLDVFFFFFSDQETADPAALLWTGAGLNGLF